jgi:hypothetical protein
LPRQPANMIEGCKSQFYLPTVELTHLCLALDNERNAILRVASRYFRCRARTGVSLDNVNVRTAEGKAPETSTENCEHRSGGKAQMSHIPHRDRWQVEKDVMPSSTLTD